MLLVLDSHDRPDGSACSDAGRTLNPDIDTPFCDCGHRITVDGGVAPGDLLPVQLHTAAPIDHTTLPEPKVCPWDHRLAVTTVLIDCWDHRAALLTWGRRYGDDHPLLLGPGYLDACRLAELIAADLPNQQRSDVTFWVLSQWRDVASPRERRGELIEEQRQTELRIRRAERARAR